MAMLGFMVAAALAAGPVTLNYEGPLDGALEKIAKEGGVNVVASGNLGEHVQVHLTGASAQEALDTLAEVYGLEVTKKGSLWVIRKPAAPSPQAKSIDEKLAALTELKIKLQKKLGKGAIPAPPSPPKPPTLPTPPAPPEVAAAMDKVREAVDEATQDAHEAAQEALRDAEEQLREQHEAANEATQEAHEAAQEALRNAEEQLREAQEGADDKSLVQGGPVVVKANTTVKDVVSYGGSVTVEENARVTGNAVAFGGELVLQENARVAGDAVAFGKDLVLKENARIDGDAVAFGGQVRKGENARVGGDEVSFGGSALGTAIGSVASQSVVRGRHGDGGHVRRHESGSGVAGFFLRFATLFGLGFLVMLFAPQRMRQLETVMTSEPLPNLAVGLASALALVPLTVLLLVTVVGIPVALLLWLSLFFFVPVGLTAAASALGTRLPTGRLRKTQALVLAVGLLVLLLAWKIPFLGSVLLGISLLLSLGAVVRTRFGQPPKGLPVLERTDTQPVGG